MQWQAAIGFAKKDSALRDQADAILGALAPRIGKIFTKYVGPMGSPLVFAHAGPQGARPDASPASRSIEKADLIKGRQVFNGTCAHCHGPNAVVAERRINLRLLREKYGDKMDHAFFATVTNGRPRKGMPTWKNIFSHQDFVNILSYLKTVQVSR